MSSMYSAFVYLEPCNRVGRTFSVDLIVLLGLPITNAPSAAPPMIRSSSGWYIAPMWPPASEYPPNTAASTIT